MARHRIVAAAASTLVLPMLSVIGATPPAAAAPSTPPAAAAPPPSDVRELARRDLTLDGKLIKTPARYVARDEARNKAGSRTSSRKAAAVTPPVGTVRQWLGLDDVEGLVYRKDYTLRAVGAHIEVWVADDLAFPADDCRSTDPTATRITSAQVDRLVSEFDGNIYPKETETFSTPPDRDGSEALVPPDGNGEGGNYAGAGNRTVTLVDNVRDANFYEFPAQATYIAGFFSPQINALVDRNVMTIDAFDWLHRTGPNPPNAPTDDLCTSRPARPTLYEGTFAHEWQHLLQSYTDPYEGLWINEGLSDYAQTLTGFVDGTATVYDRGADSHLYCYQGFGPVRTPFNANPRNCGGPQNSLNLWNEGEPAAVLADYGIAYQMMLFLADRYGPDFMSRLHRDGERQGLASLDAALEAEGVHDMHGAIHDFQTMTLVDKIVGGSQRGIMLGIAKARVTTHSVRSTVNLAEMSGYDTPGAAPNGADYVQLRKAAGQVLRGADLRSVRFAGDRTLPPTPLQWTTVRNDPNRYGNSVLWSGNAGDTDAMMVATVGVPADDPTLRLLAKYGAERDYDYGYVTVSTDGGKTYTPVAGDRTVAGPDGPAVNGNTDGFVPLSYDLSAYAGKQVLLGFRYVSDGAVNEGGWFIDDILIGDTVVSSGASLAPFRSPTQIRATEVYHWNLRLIGLDKDRSIARQLTFDGSAVRPSRADLAKLAAFPKVVAVVAYDEPTERITQYAPYTLTVNGVVQPGGR